MIVKSTDIKNNFGKYIKLLEDEDIIITKNGAPVAKIVKQTEWEDLGRISEQAAEYASKGKKMTYEEFVEFCRKSDDRYEYIDGKAYMIVSPKITHQQVVGNLFILLYAWFKGKKCRPYLSPFEVTLKKNDKNINVVQPDLLVICDPENRDEKDKYTGVPALVIEVLSESSRSLDLVKKLDLYMQACIQEYWVVDYFEKEAILYGFKDNDIAYMKVFSKDDVLASCIFENLALKLEDIFA